MRKVKDRSKRAEPPHVSEEATPFNSPCLCRFYLAGYAVSTMQAAPFIPGGFGKGFLLTKYNFINNIKNKVWKIGDLSKQIPIIWFQTTGGY